MGAVESDVRKRRTTDTARRPAREHGPEGGDRGRPRRSMRSSGAEACWLAPRPLRHPTPTLDAVSRRDTALRVHVALPRRPPLRDAWHLGERGAEAAWKLLAAMDGRHAGRRRLLRLLPWYGGTIALLTAGILVAGSLAKGRVDAGEVVVLLVLTATSALFAWFLHSRLGERLDREAPGDRGGAQSPP